jgi:hypothetical protein
MHTLLALVQAGFGITLIPRWVAREGSPDMVFRPVICSAPPYELVFAWRRGHSNKAVDRFRECAHRMFVEFEGSGRVRSTGNQYTQKYMAYICCDGGKIVHIKEYFDPHAVRSALASS